MEGWMQWRWVGQPYIEEQMLHGRTSEISTRPLGITRPQVLKTHGTQIV